MVLSLIVHALASTVITDGDVPDAIGRVAAQDRAFVSAAVVPWASLRAAPPRIVEGGNVHTCTGAPATAAAFESQVQAATSHIHYGEWEGALVALADAKATLPCLSTVPDAQTLVRLWMLGGVATVQLGDPDAARAHFVIARGIQPDLQWDNTYSPAARAAFDTTPVPQASVRLRIVAPESTDLRIDGHAIGTAVAPGWHLVQTANPARTYVIDVEPGSRATLVIPDAFGEDALAQSESSDARADLTALFAAAFGEGAPFAVVRRDRMWLGTTGRTDWTAYDAAESGDSSQETKPTRGLRVSTVLLGAGGGVAAVGGAITGGFWLAGNGARNDYRSAPTADDATASKAAFDSAVSGFAVSRWVAAGGALVASTGLTLLLLGPLAVHPSPTGLRLETVW